MFKFFNKEKWHYKPTVIEQEDNPKNDKPIMEEPIYNNYNGTVILLDNGHSRLTAGKRSPVLEDGSQFFEYEFNRDIVRRISQKLDVLGIKYHILVPEVDEDIALTARANRANKYCKQYGTDKCIFISIHANAAGNGSWMNARGWSIWTTKGETKADKVATVFYEEAVKLLPDYGMSVRKDLSDGDVDYEANFTVLYKTLCPAILTENLFMDNKIDVRFLMTNTGRNVIADIHVNAIKRLCGLC